jgi:WD40 repeat protein
MSIKLYSPMMGKQLAISSRHWLAVYTMDQETEVLLRGFDEDEDNDDSDYGGIWDSDDEDIEDSDDEGVHAILFSHNGMLLASASGDTVTLWNATTGAALQTLEIHGGEHTGYCIFSGWQASSVCFRRCYSQDMGSGHRDGFTDARPR